MAYKPLEHKFRITSYDVDCDMNLAVDKLLGYMQDTALRQTNEMGIGLEYLGQRNFFWALSKILVRISRMPKWDEEITVRTWARPHDIFTQPREFEIEDSAGSVIVRATSSWIILDGATGKFLKLEQFDERLHYLENKVAIDGTAPKIRKPDFDTAPSAFFKVRRSDLDWNHHVNNTKYIQWLFDSEEFANVCTSSLAEISVNYVSQTRLGEEYSIQTKETEAGTRVSDLIAKEGNREICRIETKFKTLA